MWLIKHAANGGATIDVKSVCRNSELCMEVTITVLLFYSAIA